jgi:hypothetical protein
MSDERGEPNLKDEIARIKGFAVIYAILGAIAILPWIMRSCIDAIWP